MKKENIFIFLYFEHDQCRNGLRHVTIIGASMSRKKKKKRDRAQGDEGARYVGTIPNVFILQCRQLHCWHLQFTCGVYLNK